MISPSCLVAICFHIDPLWCHGSTGRATAINQFTITVSDVMYVTGRATATNRWVKLTVSDVMNVTGRPIFVSARKFHPERLFKITNSVG